MQLAERTLSRAPAACMPCAVQHKVADEPVSGHSVKFSETPYDEVNGGERMGEGGGRPQHARVDCTTCDELAMDSLQARRRSIARSCHVWKKQSPCGTVGMGQQ